jgi:hypothetical protein
MKLNIKLYTLLLNGLLYLCAQKYAENVNRIYTIK